MAKHPIIEAAMSQLIFHPVRLKSVEAVEEALWKFAHRGEFLDAGTGLMIFCRFLRTKGADGPADEIEQRIHSVRQRLFYRGHRQAANMRQNARRFESYRPSPECYRAPTLSQLNDQQGDDTIKIKTILSRQTRHYR